MLRDKIESDYLEAYKAKDEFKIGVLRLLRSAIKNAEIEAKASLSDQEVIQILKRETKQRKDTILTYEKSGHAEAAAKELEEIKLLETYLPKQLDDIELKEIVEEAIGQIGAKDMSQMGQVIALVMKDHGDNVDGGRVSKIVRDFLQK